MSNNGRLNSDLSLRWLQQQYSFVQIFLTFLGKIKVGITAQLDALVFNTMIQFVIVSD